MTRSSDCSQSVNYFNTVHCDWKATVSQNNKVGRRQSLENDSTTGMPLTSPRRMLVGS